MRKVKLNYRVSIPIFGIIFSVVYAYMTNAGINYEFQCEGSTLHEDLNLMVLTLRIVCGVHCLFKVLSTLVLAVQAGTRLWKRMENDGYLSSDEEDDREFDDEEIEKDMQQRHNLQKRIEKSF